MAGNFAKFVLQVNNIPWTVSRQQLALYFSQFGYVHNTIVVFDKKSGLGQGHGYVTFLKKDQLDTVLERKHTLEGKNLILSLKSGEPDLSNDILN